MSAALFACAKCYSRHPFEELSPDYQLCKECRLACPMVKCTYCRTEFQQESKSSTITICKKCDQNVKAYGKPSVCNICKLFAAFIGGRCQRCTYFERFHGPPQMCKQCKQKSAFDKNGKNKYDGKLLCYICEVACRKAKAREKLDRKVSGGGMGKDDRNEKKNSKAWMNSPPKDENDNGDVGDVTIATSSSASMMASLRRAGGTTTATSYKREHEDSPNVKTTSSYANLLGLSNSASKKLKMEEKSSPMLAGSGSFLSDTGIGGSDHMIVITNLREEVASVKKQLAQKNMLVMEKEKKIAELNATILNNDTKAREQIQNSQKSYQNQIDDLMRKNRELQMKLNEATKQRGGVSLRKKNRLAAVAGGSTGLGGDSPLVDYINTTPDTDGGQ